MSTEKDIDFVLRTVEARDIRFVRLWFTDVLGTLKSFAISPEELEEAFEEGIGFDGSSIDGFARLEESDMLAFPDAETFQLLPWRPTESGVARVFCNICTPSREPFAGDPRGCLERVFERADHEGYVFNVGPKLRQRCGPRASRHRRLLRPHAERRGQRPAPPDHAHAREDVRPRAVLLPWRRPVAERH